MFTALITILALTGVVAWIFIIVVLFYIYMEK
jgi:hypothetical protein